MDISTMGTVLAIVVITYLIGLLCKSLGSIRDELIPVIAVLPAPEFVLFLPHENSSRRIGMHLVRAGHRRHVRHPGFPGEGRAECARGRHRVGARLDGRESGV